MGKKSEFVVLPKFLGDNLVAQLLAGIYAL
jgi:hypothetical protein